MVLSFDYELAECVPIGLPTTARYLCRCWIWKTSARNRCWI